MNNYILQEKRRKQRKDERTLARIAKYRRSKRAGAIVLAALTAGIWGFCFYALDKQIQPEPADIEETVSNVAESESNVTNSATRGAARIDASGSECVITAYCPCEKCCGIWAKNRPNGVVYTASGEVAQEGVTVAADWDVYPAGTVLYIEGMGEYIVQDVGGAVNGNHIDVYFDTHEKAVNFGKQTAFVEVLCK